MRANKALRAGFTLIELLVVLVIIAILAAAIIPNFVGKTDQARIARAQSDISVLKTALSAFETDNGRFPTSSEGLQALVEKPAADLPGWKHYYIEKLPNDPWTHPYIYRCPGSNGKDFDLFSTGPSGQEGGSDNID